MTIRKKIIDMTTGAIIIPKILPSLIQAELKGPNNFEFKRPKIKKIKDGAKNQ